MTSPSRKTFTIAQAAEVLGISEQRTTLLKGDFKKSGMNAPVHKSIGVLSAHAVPEATRQEIVALMSTVLFEKVTSIIIVKD